MSRQPTGETPPPPVPVPQPLAITRALAERLLPRAEELGTVLRDTLLIKDERYATTDLIAAEELLRSCRDNMVRSLQSLADRIPPGVDVFDAAQITARRRADAGFPLESVLHAYRLGTEVIWAAILDEARSRAPELLDELLDSAVQVMQLIDLMSTAVADEYRTRELEAKRRDIERRQAILDGLLEGRAADPGFAAEAMRILELTSAARIAVVVIRHRASPGPPPSPGAALAAAGFRSEWRLRADREIGLVELGQATVTQLVGRLSSIVDGWVGVSQETVGLADVVTEFRMAELVLASLPAEKPGVAALTERLPQVLVAANRPIADRIRSRALGDLLSLPLDKQESLLETLGRWFANNRSTSATATEMHCHRNTVVYRLKQIEDLTGCRLDDGDDQMLLRLALLAS
ncbi:sugar diacid utilization regulator [Nocardioides albertanoniae]|uniref:Sugar diacid utilization regulator n=1 Tax=Nocardioides albertanoniae TaxID=1175486 RepID=A0A543A1T8_9ACTN|nr:PucR family transcriptional regulator [Nocardioides albertanoniae]TQL66549.1 sugar diacid utilization regulator [Nocardioides albertanoniae]